MGDFYWERIEAWLQKGELFGKNFRNVESESDFVSELKSLLNFQNRRSQDELGRVPNTRFLEKYIEKEGYKDIESKVASKIANIEGRVIEVDSKYIRSVDNIDDINDLIKKVEEMENLGETTKRTAEQMYNERKAIIDSKISKRFDKIKNDIKKVATFKDVEKMANREAPGMDEERRARLAELIENERIKFDVLLIKDRDIENEKEKLKSLGVWDTVSYPDGSIKDLTVSQLAARDVPQTIRKGVREIIVNIKNLNKERKAIESPRYKL